VRPPLRFATTNQDPASQPFPLDLLTTVLLSGAAFALYFVTLAPTILAGDGGEFQFVPYLLGVAHPTGYPLYCLLGWAWSHLLPFGDVAYRLNLFSAFWAALAVGLLYPTARTLLRQALPQLSPLAHRLLAALAATTFAVTPTFWSQSVIAEVYSLHIFFVVLILYLLLSWAAQGASLTSSPQAMGNQRGRRLLLLAAGIFGLSLTHHRTTLLLAPAILAYVWLAGPWALRQWRRLGLPALLLVLLPLALYLYIPLRAPHTPYLHLPLAEGQELVLYDNTPASFFDFVLGAPFGGSLDFSLNLGPRLAMGWGFLRAEVGWIGIGLALLGLLGLALARKWALLALTGLLFGTTVAFDLVYTIGDIYVLFVPAYLVVVLWLVLGVGALARLARRQALLAALLVLPFFVLPLWLAATHYPAVDQSQNTRARVRWHAILSQPLPPASVLLSDDRNNIMPMWYFQYVDGQRPDLLGLFPLITPEIPALGQVLDLAMATERPVYLIKEMPGVEVKVDVQAEAGGGLWRVLGPAVVGEPAYQVEARLADAVQLVGYDRAPRTPRPGETLQVGLYWQALRPLDAEYHTFVHLLDAQGSKVAQSDRQPGGIYYPTTLWQPGERLRDDHLLNLPDGTPPGVYRLLVGMYALSSDGTLLPLDEPLVAGEVAVKEMVQTLPSAFEYAVEANFGGQIELLGYDAARHDGMLDVTLQWRCLRPSALDYTVFIHLQDPGGNTIAQADGQPQNGAYPTSIWDAGEVVPDPHTLSLPPELPPGDYRLWVGLYRLETGERLQVVGGADSVELGLVKVGD
jgi:hypothetical protein